MDAPHGFAIDLSDKDAWDDTVLIRAYDRAVYNYQVLAPDPRLRGIVSLLNRCCPTHIALRSRTVACLRNGLQTEAPSSAPLAFTH